jgi:hypothetical protein
VVIAPRENPYARDYFYHNVTINGKKISNRYGIFKGQLKKL